MLQLDISLSTEDVELLSKTFRRANESATGDVFGLVGQGASTEEIDASVAEIESQKALFNKILDSIK